MSVFVITTDLFRKLPCTEYGSVLFPFTNSTKDLSISMDDAGVAKRYYCSVFDEIDSINRGYLYNWFDLLGKMNGQGGRNTIIKVSIDKNEEYVDEESLFLEVSFNTNNLNGMIVPDCQSLNNNVCDDMVEYKNKKIRIFSIIEAKEVINNHPNIVLNASDQGIVKNNKITINNYYRND